MSSIVYSNTVISRDQYGYPVRCYHTHSLGTTKVLHWHKDLRSKLPPMYMVAAPGVAPHCNPTESIVCSECPDGYPVTGSPIRRPGNKAKRL